MASNKLVPFGKYKGQPVEVLQADEPYMRWLEDQPWFRERFPSIHTLIVNQFGEPAETPEHNALQARFLDDGFCRRFLEAYWLYEFGISAQDQNAIARVDVSFEASNPRSRDPKIYDVVLVEIDRAQRGRAAEVYVVTIECKPTLGDEYPAVLRQMRANKTDVLLVGEYVSTTVTWEQVQDIFDTIACLRVTDVLE